MASAKPSLAVWKFASCDGCQLTLLNLEDRFVDLTRALNLKYFPEAIRANPRGPFDISLVEGSVTTTEDAARIRKIRKRSRVLVAIGACATTGGIQALRNLGNIRDFQAAVYARPDWIETLDRSEPISALVPVDIELQGCPIDKDYLFEVLTALIHGKKPSQKTEPVCLECKRRGNACLTVTSGIPCLGPITLGGCGAICPSYGRGCYSCFGPVPGGNTEAMIRLLKNEGLASQDIALKFQGINLGAMKGKSDE